MLVEVEARDGGTGGAVEIAAVHCLSTPAIVWNEKEIEGVGGKKEAIVDYWRLKLHLCNV